MKRSSRVAARHATAAAKSSTLFEFKPFYLKQQHKSIAMTSLATNTSCQERQHMQRRHHSHHIMNQSISQPPPPQPPPAPSIIITPPPSPQLLLEGDEMYISSDGKSHTYYRLHPPHPPASSNHHYNNAEYVLEEAYDIEHARKEITVLLQQHSSADNHNDDRSTSSTQQQQEANKVIITFPLQEITNGIQSGAGTGSTTWDSSIVMGLYFGNMHPEELVGDVLELGSGVGLGGILTGVLSKNGGGDCEEKERSCSVNSLTLSEVNRDVLHMLRYNTAVAAEAAASSNNASSVGRLLEEGDKLHIDTLDWFDFVTSAPNDQSTTNTNNERRRKKYDTIIASDCIYRPSQVQPLSNTIATLLKRGGGGQSHNPTAHIFSPYNRGFIPDLIKELRDGKDLIVDVETIEMDIVRVKLFNDDGGCENNVDDNVSSLSRLNWLLGDDIKKSKRHDNDVVSSRTSKFLHITASFKRDAGCDHLLSDESMTSID